MFDWNDEEITEIIWGEPEDRDEHIVPYPECCEGIIASPLGELNKKLSLQHRNNNAVNSEDNVKSEVKNDVTGVKLEASVYGAEEELSALGFDLTWSNLVPANTDSDARDSMGTEASSKFTSMANFNLEKDEPELFGNEHVDTDGDSFLDYSWDNIGNFDDLDRIFRNDESILGRENLGNASEIWSSSHVADLIGNSPARSFSIPTNSPGSDFQASRSATDQCKVKLEHQGELLEPVPGRQTDFHFSGLSVPSSKDKSADMVNQTEVSTETTTETARLKSYQIMENQSGQNPVVDKGNEQKRCTKNRKKQEVNNGKTSNKKNSTWSTGVNTFQQYTNARMSGSALQAFSSATYCGPKTVRYLHPTNPYAHMRYGYPIHQFPIMPQLQNVHSERDSVLNSYKVSPDSVKQSNNLHMSADTQVRLPAMTPQEKIEKLRKRQQIQALLAIQQQQQKLGHHISGLDQSDFKEKHQGAVVSNAEEDENAANFHLQSSLELDFYAEHKDGSKNSMLLDEYSLAERIFLQLQEAIAKLDHKTRLCIQDSLFRLAKSAMRRHGVSDTSSTNKISREESDFHGCEETNSHKRSSKITDVETGTNPIDRTVAHLLFHRLPDPSATPPMNDGSLESPLSGNSEKYHVQLKGESEEPASQCLTETLIDKVNIYECEPPGSKLLVPAHDLHKENVPQPMPKTQSKMDDD